MEDYLPLIIHLISGALGGNLAGRLIPNYSMGVAGNSVAGVLGGGIGGWILGMLGLVSIDSGLDLFAVLGNIVGGALGGGLIMVVLGTLKKAFVR